jgi:CDP-3, 6-dideoxy-D-glycero-L-glycero-4-hexulose-4-reductase
VEAASINGCKQLINIGSYIQNYFSDEYFASCLYAATKQSMENSIDFYVANRAMSAITLKLYDVYGKNDSRKKILNLFKEISESGRNLKMSQGEQEMRLTHIDDVLEAFKITIDLMKISIENKNKHSIYYVGSKSYSLKKIAKIFEKTTKKSLNIEWGAFPYRANQPLKSHIGEILPNWKSKISLEEGIKNL